MAFIPTQDRLNAKALARFGVRVMLGGVPVQADYTAPQRAAEMGEGMQIAGRRPALTVLEADGTSAPVGLSVAADPTDAHAVALMGANAYEVAEANPDGLGLTVLALRKV